MSLPKKEPVKYLTPRVNIPPKIITKNKTPNKIIPIKTRTHIKIKSRDLNSELNLKTENNIYNIHKPQLRPNKTLNNLTTLKINQNS